MSSIAYSNGFFWQTLWNHPLNAALKAQRKNPNVLMTGDIVHIPDLTVRQESGATEARYVFKLKGVPEIFRMKLLDANHKPRAGLAYKLVIDGKPYNGSTDGKGEIKVGIPPNAKGGVLTVPTCPDKTGKLPAGAPKNQVYNLQFGTLNPVSEVSGFKSRLANLGFYQGPIDDNLDGPTQQAIRSFQGKMGLPRTGLMDDATKGQLQGLHGH